MLLSGDERDELAAAVRGACERLAPEERVREVAYEVEPAVRGFDAKLWAVLCQQVGVTAITLPEELGGGGYGANALGVVAHELGRTLAPVPFLASAVLATDLLVTAGAPDDRLQPLIEGERTAAAVLTESGGLWGPAAVSITARDASGSWLVDGTARHILHGPAADDLVVIARADGELGLFLVDSADPGVTTAVEDVLDGTRPMAAVTFDGARAQRLQPSGPVDVLVERCVNRALAVMAAEQVGAMERVLEIATEYARTREQFGRPIGSFQAIKHRCADMLVALEMARSSSMAALESLDGGDGEEAWRASMAKAVCSEALRDATHANVQIHGGIGFTWEGSAGLYVRRARTDEVLFGLPGAHWDRLREDAKLF